MSSDSVFDDYVVFDGHRRLAAGSLSTMALTFKRAIERNAAGPVLIFDNATGRSIDVDTSGSDGDVAARYAQSAGSAQSAHERAGQAPSDAAVASAADDDGRAAQARGRGRPKLGVVAREVTLLPRHWAWLAEQPGGASVALRKLVDEARRANAPRDARRQAHERAYHFMSAIAGDLPGFEEATRSLFVDDRARMAEQMAGWPADVREHAIALAFGTGDADVLPATRRAGGAHR